MASTQISLWTDYEIHLRIRYSSMGNLYIASRVLSSQKFERGYQLTGLSDLWNVVKEENRTTVVSQIAIIGRLPSDISENTLLFRTKENDQPCIVTFEIISMEDLEKLLKIPVGVMRAQSMVSLVLQDLPNQNEQLSLHLLSLIPRSFHSLSLTNVRGQVKIINDLIDQLKCFLNNLTISECDIDDKSTSLVFDVLSRPMQITMNIDVTPGSMKQMLTSWFNAPIMPNNKLIILHTTHPHQMCEYVDELDYADHQKWIRSDTFILLHKTKTSRVEGVVGKQQIMLQFQKRTGFQSSQKKVVKKRKVIKRPNTSRLTLGPGVPPPAANLGPGLL